MFVGPSGCGKSTLLRMIAGLEEISAGDLEIGGKRMNEVDPSKRGIAIVRKPEVFLFDEPLSNVDAELRVHMRIELAKLHKALAATVVYVTHDQVEAMTLADKIVVMNQGVISQVGTPLEVYDDPDNMFVAGFIGSPKINFINGIIGNVTKTGAVVILPNYDNTQIRFTAKNTNLVEGAAVTVGLRPQHFDTTGSLKFKLNVELIEHLGGESFVYGGNCTGELITVATQSGRGLVAGQKFEARIDPAKALLFDANGQRIR